MGTDEEIDSHACVDCNMAPTLMVCRPSPAGRFGRGTEVGDATMIYSVKVLLLRPAQPEPEFSIALMQDRGLRRKFGSGVFMARWGVPGPLSMSCRGSVVWMAAKRFIVACVVIPASRSPRRSGQSRGRQSSVRARSRAR
jgi:hypothetical protein